jgi:hypothetical protein
MLMSGKTEMQDTHCASPLSWLELRFSAQESLRIQSFPDCEVRRVLVGGGGQNQK